MNARQKAKKYKKMYEDFLKCKKSLIQPVKYEVNQCKIDTLRCERFYPEALIAQEDSNSLRKVIIKDIAQTLANSLDKYINYYTEFCPHKNEYRFRGEIKVVAESEEW